MRICLDAREPTLVHFYRVLCLTFSMAAAALTLAIVPQEASAVAPQYQCTNPGVIPGLECKAPEVTPWAWTDYQLGFGEYLTGWWHLEAAIERAVWNAFMVDGYTSWCSLTLAQYRSSTSTLGLDAGIPIRQKDLIDYDVVS